MYARIFDAPLDRQRLVVGSRLPRQKVLAEHAWPQHGAATLGRDDEAEVVELGTAARLDV